MTHSQLSLARIGEASSARKRNTVEIEFDVLAARREDLLVERFVAGIGGDPAPFEIVEFERGQHADHDQLRVVQVHPLVGAPQRRPQRLFEFEGFVAGETSRLDVHLDVELAEFGLEDRVIVDRLEHLEVRHRGRHVVADEVELDLHAEMRFG